MSDDKAPDPIPGHVCPREFERQYMAMYDLPDHKHLRRVTLAEVQRIKRTHGESDPNGERLTGPPKDWETALAEATARAQARMDALKGIAK